MDVSGQGLDAAGEAVRVGDDVAVDAARRLPAVVQPATQQGPSAESREWGMTGVARDVFVAGLGEAGRGHGVGGVPDEALVEAVRRGRVVARDRAAVALPAAPACPALWPEGSLMQREEGVWDGPSGGVSAAPLSRAAARARRTARSA